MIGGAGVFCRRELDEEVVADGVGADTVGGAGAGAVVGLESGMTEGMSNSGGRIYAEWTGKTWKAVLDDAKTYLGCGMDGCHNFCVFAVILVLFQ